MHGKTEAVSWSYLRYRRSTCSSEWGCALLYNFVCATVWWQQVSNWGDRHWNVAAIAFAPVKRLVNACFEYVNLKRLNGILQPLVNSVFIELSWNAPDTFLTECAFHTHCRCQQALLPHHALLGMSNEDFIVLMARWSIADEHEMSWSSFCSNCDTAFTTLYTLHWKQ